MTIHQSTENSKENDDIGLKNHTLTGEKSQNMKAKRFVRSNDEHTKEAWFVK